MCLVKDNIQKNLYLAQYKESEMVSWLLYTLTAQEQKQDQECIFMHKMLLKD